MGIIMSYDIAGIISSAKAGVSIDVENNHCILTLPEYPNKQLKVQGEHGYINMVDKGWVRATDEFMSQFFK
jgi:hypothetical protein